MASDYQKVKSGRLKLKGNKKLGPSKASLSMDVNPGKRKLLDEGTMVNSDEAAHGGWWVISNEKEVKAGNVAIETAPHTYILSLDDGKFTLGAPHSENEGPAPEEIFTMMKTPDMTGIALKSGYGKYLSVDARGMIIATADAIGIKERLELVFEDGKMALQAYNNCFVCYEPDKEGYLYANSKAAKDLEVVKLRTNNEREKPVDYTPEADKKNIIDCEKAYVAQSQNLSKDYHKFKTLSYEEVKRAKTEGTLHECLLDRREKTKADRYCK